MTYLRSRGNAKQSPSFATAKISEDRRFVGLDGCQECANPIVQELTIGGGSVIECSHAELSISSGIR